ncbi:hypothetical protein F503_03199 [Ophiostoma piceae UAMH 11346]|uniref:Restriction of telomere capping protein 4 n=1 Tax=Ophiostoma piceae (strain UAMH 11346) TaxID=1262450 RepID=S3C207_OPHP1|nr:hypothetical protein F503_03199 [Ophiostoma piceae UAMH 11346]
MHNRPKFRSQPLGIAAPSSLLVRRVNESRAKAQKAKERPVDAPPESSEDDDDDSYGKAKDTKAEDISDVSDDEPRGTIKSSSFGKTTSRPVAAPAPAGSRTTTPSSRRPGLLLSQRHSGRSENNDDDSAASNVSNGSTRGTKRPRGADSLQISSKESRDSAKGAKTGTANTKKEVDLSAKNIEFGGRTKPRQGYGTARKPSSQPAFKPPPAALTDDSPPRRASKRADSKPATFKRSKYDDDDSEEDKKSVKKGTKPTKPAFKQPKYNMSSDEEKEKKKAGDKTAKDKTAKDKTKSTSLKNKSSGIFGRRKADDDDDDKNKDETPPRAVFRMPEYDSLELGPDIDVAAFDDDDLDSSAHDQVDDTPQQPVCPLCKKTVDDDTISALLPGHYLLKRPGVVRLNQLKFDEKVMFCAGHKQRASRHAWAARGYPAIDWDALPARLEPHYAHVKKVLLGGASTYRDSYEGSRKALDEVALVPGYYGRRGQQVLSAAIIQRLSDVLRQQAVEDPVVAARGMVQYVQAVLVPELAVQLIREDMGGLIKVTAAEGRRVLGESAAIGEAVMEEERDVVAEESEEEYGESEYESDATV